MFNVDGCLKHLFSWISIQSWRLLMFSCLLQRLIHYNPVSFISSLPHEQEPLNHPCYFQIMLLGLLVESGFTNIWPEPCVPCSN